METPLLKRRLNPILRISTVLTLALIAGMSVVYQDQLNNLVSDNKDLQQQLEDRKQTIEGLESENEDLEDRASTLNSTSNQLQELIDEKNQTIEEQDSTITSLRDDNQDLENQVEGLNSTVVDLEANISEIENDLEDICENDDNNLTDGSDETCEDYGY